MLGCQDFCGYYEWTFHFLRRKFGQEGVDKFWREAIAADAQSHYITAGQQSALRGLYECWSHTGDSEQCNWTVSLDEARNHLRLDMRECPSKGFLLKNDLNADEDYCDHCIGWIGPALAVLDAEVVAHEHNHCGQCWWQIAMKGQASDAPRLDADIRRDARWQHGYLDRFEHSVRTNTHSSHDDANLIVSIESLFADASEVLVLGDDHLQSAKTDIREMVANSIVTDRAYLNLPPTWSEPRCLLLGYDLPTLNQVADRWSAKVPEDRPELFHSFLPGSTPISFTEIGFERPRPILPILIKRGLYVHDPGGQHPSNSLFAMLLAMTLEKDVAFIGVPLHELGSISARFAESMVDVNRNDSLGCVQQNLRFIRRLR